MSRSAPLLLLLLAACRTVPTTGPATGPVPHEDLSGVTWLQTAPEYRAIAVQTFRLAADRLDQALSDPSWSAIPSLADGPPAIIADLDETILDNSPLSARMVLRPDEDSWDLWVAWCAEGRAGLIPGALEFLRHAEARGVAIFYVTNRDSDCEAATRRNIADLELPLDERDGDRLLTRGEREAWVSDKASRRELVAADHRVILLVGDDLNDFVSGARAERGIRDQLFADAADRWGRSWIMLPNPVYGSWKRALTHGRSPASEDEELVLRYEQLEPHWNEAQQE